MARKLAALAVIALMLAGAALVIYPWTKRIERRSAVPAFSDSAIVPNGVEQVAAAIIETFNDGHRLGFSSPRKFSAADKFHYFFLWNRADQIFPDDLQVSLHTRYDPALRRYSAMDPGAKRRDFYLYEPTGDHYWYSEYFCDGAPAKFRCAFIIHLEPLGPDRTRVQVLEYLQMIWVGQAWSTLGHSGPGFYDDIRFDLEPTMIDRAELLALVERAVAAPGTFERPQPLPSETTSNRKGALKCKTRYALTRPLATCRLGRRWEVSYETQGTRVPAGFDAARQRRSGYLHTCAA